MISRNTTSKTPDYLDRDRRKPASEAKEALRMAEIRARLAGTLHVQPFALAVGGLAAVVAGGVAAASSGEPTLYLMTGLLFIVGAAKLGLGLMLHLLGGLQARSRVAYMVLAVAHSLLIGLTGALAIDLTGPGYASLFAAGFAFGFGSGIAMRHAGNMVLVGAQVFLCLVPIFVACLLQDAWQLHVMAAILPPMALVMISIARDLNARLTTQIAAGEEQEKLARRIRMESETDPVTGLRNRAGFAGAASLLAGMVPEGECMALLWVDLHRFRDVNATFGHEAGDRMLVQIGQRLTRTAPDDAVLSRYGGDDFLIACPVADAAAAEQLAGEILEQTSQSVRLAGERVASDACIGVALSAPGAPGAGKAKDAEEQVAELVRQADLALFHAKIAGHGEVRFFAPEMSRDRAQRKELESELRAAIQKDELSVYFQPIIDLGTGRIRAFEALVRWFHPERGELRPDQFIPVAEASGLIITLGNWITQTAARACASWPAHIDLAVNLSPAQIRAPGAALGVLAALREAGLDPARLQLEITEGLFARDDANITHFMDELAKAGVRFALDDFGTGNSSLNYVTRYPFHTIKVDRSFVSGPQTGPRSDAIIRAVTEMGATLNMDICAEGLETAEQIAFVREAGCTLGQGYYFSRAVPDHMAARLLEEDALEGDGRKKAG